jgi:GH3 auxin-responsive promoter
MRARVNDCLRSIIGSAIVIAGLISNAWLRLRIVLYARNQKRLKRKYGINSDTPVAPYGPQIVQSIRTKAGRRARFAQTSGSTGKAKEILYTKRRLLALKLTFSEMFARACYAFAIKRTSLYVFSSFQTDESVTSLLLDEDSLPSYLSTLQAPYRVQQHPAIRSLMANYGSTAVRFWILTISNPGMLYSTNPSTISTFLDELASDWQRSCALISDWHHNPRLFPSDVHKIARRLDSRGSADRIELITKSNAPLPLSTYAPAVSVYTCWTGGYVKPFLDRLAVHLLSPRYRLIPMYSMSTETIETLPYFRSEDIAFFPVGAGVVYEFTDGTRLLEPQQLEPGSLYLMVVSDRYGLRRYQTDDLFLCKRKLNGLPDLVFARRRSLEYSFTGEKLTAEQLSAVFDQLRTLYPSLLVDKFLTCVPSQPPHALPHYKVLLIGDSLSSGSHHLLAIRCDELLSEINCEYKSKRASGRLGPITVIEAPKQDFPSQFKFLPLYRHEDDVLLAIDSTLPRYGTDRIQVRATSLDGVSTVTR